MIYYLLSSRCQREVHHESYQHSRLPDNYIWLLDDRQGRCIIVDPGEAQPVLEALQRLQLVPAAILLTHHHHDHVDGVAQIVAQYPGPPSMGRKKPQTKAPITSSATATPLTSMDASTGR